MDTARARLRVTRIRIKTCTWHGTTVLTFMPCTVTTQA
jgi:hypothetical protein